MKRIKYIVLAAVLLTTSLLSPLEFGIKRAAAVSASDWQAGRIIDDSLFTDQDSMSAAQIQAFLNAQVPNCDTNGTQPATEWGRSDLTHAQYATQVKGWPGPPYVCLRNYYEVPKTSPGAGMPDNSYNHGGNPPAGSISAAQMIYNAAQQYHISPKVLLIKIRSESAGPLTNDSWPLQSQYTYAMGAHCPDSGPNHSANCDPNYAGFSIQISEAAALLRYYLDNMTQSWWPYKKLGVNNILYNPDPSCGSSNVNIVTSGTAALYTYTPYQPNAGALAAGYGTATCGAYGNRNFWLYYNEWFGSTLNGTCIQNGNTAVNTSVGYQKVSRSLSQGLFLINSGSGSHCVEAHAWAAGATSWQSHIASNLPNIDPTTSQVEFGDLNGDGRDEAILVDYGNTGSGNVEFHVWSPGMQTWQSHIASNLPTSQYNPANESIQFADLTGRGYDQAVLTQSSGTGSGNVEFHVWSPGMQTWQSHIASNLPTSQYNPANESIQFADLTGRGYDQAMLTLLTGSGSGNVEFHVWSPWMQTWQTHIASNLPSLTTPSNYNIDFADNGGGYDQAVLVGLKNTGSGHIEFHTWNPGMQTWQSHVASNQ